MNLVRNMNDVKATKLKPISTYNPVCRHDCTLSYYDGNIYLFGGTTYGLRKACQWNDLWVYSISNNIWKQIIVLEDTLPKSENYRTVIHKHFIIFMGLSGKDEYYVYVFNILSNNCKGIKTKNNPIHTTYFGITVFKKHIIIIGGLNNFVVYTMKINDIIDDKEPEFKIIQSFDPNIYIPSSKITVIANKLYIFGGYSEKTSEFSNNLFICHNISQIFKNNQPSHLIKAIISNLLSNRNDTIPSDILATIELFCGVLFTSIKLKTIKPRSDYGMAILNINNLSKLFIYGGLTTSFVTLDDAFIIDM